MIIPPSSFIPNKRKLANPFDKPSFEQTQRYGLNRKHPLTNGLIGCWLLNENAGNTIIDLSGNGHHLVNNGAKWVSSVYGPTLDFDSGNSDYLETSGELVSDYPFSFSAWFKVDISEDNLIIGIFDSSSTSRWQCLRVFSNSVLATSRNPNPISAIYALPSDSWFHAVGVFESATSRILYVQGKLKDTDSTNVSFFTPDKIAIGRASDSTPSAYCDGMINNVLAYDRIITADEAMQLYNDPYGIYAKPKLVFYVAGGISHLSINVSDSITASESLGPDLPLAGVSISDTVSLNELIDLILTLKPSLGDAITVSDVITAILHIKPNVFDEITLTDIVTVINELPGVSLSDSITIAEDIQALIGAADLILIDKYDAITITENVICSLPLALSISDVISVLDNIEATTGYDLIVPSVSDSITLAEFVSARMTINVSVSDSISIAEYVSIGKTYLEYTISDSITMSEYLFLSIMAPYEYKKILEFVTMVPNPDFETRVPNLDFITE